MRYRHLLLGLGLAACGKAQAGSVQASFVVTVTVVDQCIVRPLSRSASCTGQAAYAIGVAREKIDLSTGGQLTHANEHVHTAIDGPLIATSMPAGDGQDTGLAAIAGRSVTPASNQIEATRVTYSF